MSEKLKPCPFCGGEAKLLQMDTDGVLWGIFCMRDVISEYQHGHFIDNYVNAESAINAWNRGVNDAEGKTA